MQATAKTKRSHGQWSAGLVLLCALAGTAARAAEPAGAITPSDLKENQAVTPSDLKQNEAVTPSDLRRDKAVSPGSLKPNRAVTPSNLKENQAITPSDLKKNKAVTPGSLKENKAVTPSNLKKDKAISPSDLKPNQAVTPSDLREQVAPKRRKALPSTPEKVEPTAGEPEITRLSRSRAQQGHRVRIEGRFFGPEAGERVVKVTTRGPDDRIHIVRMGVERWSDDGILVTVPADAVPGAGSISLETRDSFVLDAADFEVLAAGGSLGTAGADPGGAVEPAATAGGGGFARNARQAREALEPGGPELYFGDLPDWDRFPAGYNPGLHYGEHETVRFTVVNGGDEAATFRAAYQIEDQAPHTSGVMHLDPGAEKPVTLRVDLTTSLSPAAESRIAREHKLRIRIFVANGEPTGRYNYEALLYRDGRVDNHVRVADYPVASHLEVGVELDRLRQYGRCENFAQSRDWMFMILLEGHDYIARDLDDDERPPWLESSVRSASSVAPPVRYRLPADHVGTISTTPQLFALKNNGRVKNSGRSAGFPISERVDTLVNRGPVTRWIRSEDRGGSFCGRNLAVRARLEAKLLPY